MGDSYKTRLWIGIDDPIIDVLQDARSGSAWLAQALETFFQKLGPDSLGRPAETAPMRQARAYQVELPQWAQIYLSALPRGYQTRLVRAAAWYQLGRLSNSIDVDALFERLMIVAGEASPVPLSSDQKQDIMAFVDQF